MGDTGSNLLGYLLATVAVLGALKTNAVVALFFPLIVLAVPILDGGFVIAKRLKYRRPVYAADRWHFHHRMANIGFSQRRTLLYLYGWALVLAGLALALRFVPYSDNHGHFDAAWTVVIVACGVAALAASVYLVVAARDPQAAPLPPPSAGRLAGPGRAAAGGGGRGRRARARDGQLRRAQPRDRRVRGDRPRHGGVRGDRAERRGVELRPPHERCGRRTAPGIGADRGSPERAVSDIFGPRRLEPACAGAERLSVPLAPDRPELSRPEFDSPDDRESPRQGGCRRRGRPSAGGDDRLRGGRASGSARSWALPSRPDWLGCSRGSSWVLRLSTLAIEGSSELGGGGRAALAVRYADLALLALALPVFLLAGWPLLGYAVAAGGVARAARDPDRGHRAASRAPRSAATAGRRSGSWPARPWRACG